MERRLPETMAVKMEATVIAATSANQQAPQWQRPQAQQNQRPGIPEQSSKRTKYPD